MGTNITTKKVADNVQSHKTKIELYVEHYSLTVEEATQLLELFDKHIEYGYTELIIAMAAGRGKGYTSQVVRNVKNGYYKNQELFNMLIEFVTTQECEAVAAANLLASVAK